MRRPVELPGFGWAGDYEIQLVIHYIAAVVFSAGVLFHIVYHKRRRETAAMAKRGDMRESWRIIKAMVLRRPEPPQGKFLAEQRVAYAAIGVTSLILIATGVLKSLKNFNGVAFGETALTVITLIHTFAAMFFMLLFFAHLFAFVIKPNWPLFTTMFTGKVNKSYAEHRHPEWDFEAEQPADAAAANTDRTEPPEDQQRAA